MPQVAVVTGCTPNHLDWHESFADYVAAKQRILTGQTPADFAVLNTFDAEVASWSPLVRGRPASVRLPDLGATCVATPPLARAGPSTTGSTPPVRLRRPWRPGASTKTSGEGLERFHALPQRLEWFAVVEGRRFYNDSTATTPESTIAALRSLDMPVWLLAGGKNKGADFEPLAAEIVRRASGAAFFGSRRGRASAVRAPPGAAVPMRRRRNDGGGPRWCWPHSRPGEAVVLSPACASTDQFRNFRQRGERFVELVRQLCRAEAAGS